MKRARFIIILIAAILCTNIALAQEKTELQQVIDSVEQIRYITFTNNDGWGGMPHGWELQEKLKALATDDDLARIVQESKSAQARVFAYTVLLEKKSDKCFDLLKNMITDDSKFGYRGYDVCYNERINDVVISWSIRAGILDSTQIAYIDSVVIFTPNFPECSYIYEALERAVPKPEYYDRICQIFNEGHWGALEYIAIYHKEEDIDKIINTLNEYKIKTYAWEWDSYEDTLESQGEEEAEKIKPKHPRQENHSEYAINAIAQWSHPAFIPTLDKYIKYQYLSDKKHYLSDAWRIMYILMNYDNDWAYKIMERYLKHPMTEEYTEQFAGVYQNHENKERFTPLFKKYCHQSNIVLVVSSNQEGRNDSIYYTLDIAQKEATVTSDGTGYISNYSGNIVIPSTITYNDITYTVTSIGEKAFYQAQEIDSVTMPNTITSIGEEAFSWCHSLKSIKLSESLTSIADGAFSACESLSSITFPKTLTSIGDKAFYSCFSLSSIIIPRSVTNIAGGAFMFSPITSIVVDKDNPIYDSRNNCNAIIETKTNKLIMGCATTIIPNNVTSIGDMAFHGCDSIRTLAIPESVTEIGENAFTYCNNITSITLPNTIKSIGASAFQGCRGLQSINIPLGVKRIEKETFQECIKLTNITIPNSVTSIGEEAFGACQSLTSVHIGKSLATFENNMFYNCDTIISIFVDKDNPYFDSRNDCNAIINKKTNELVLGFNTTIIPNTVTRIKDHAFMYCNELKTIVIPESVKHIGESAFYDCRNLESVTLPSSLKTIGEDAFLGCIKLKNITTFSKTPQKIGDSVFPRREAQRDEDGIYCKYTKKVIFIHVPKGCKDEYLKANIWKEFTITEDAEIINEK